MCPPLPFPSPKAMTKAAARSDLPVSSPEERISDLLSLKQVVGQLPPEDPEADRPALLLWQDPNPDGQVLGLTQVQVSRREEENPHLPKGKTPGMRLTPLPSSGTIGANDDKGAFL